MTTAAVKATNGQTYLGAAGVSIGFADAVSSPDAEFLAVLGLDAAGPSARRASTTTRKINR